MTLLAFPAPRMLAGMAMSLLLVGPALAQNVEENLEQVIVGIERNLDARVGVTVRDTASDWQWSHRGDERFIMASTFKSVLCGAVLDRVDDSEVSLSDAVQVEASDIIEYAPVAEPRVGEAMTIDELCLATLDMSDNTAANLLIDRLGGPHAVTDFVRSLGDEITRLDRMEPELNTPSGDLDTTSPNAMAASWDAMLLGETLSPSSRKQLIAWMSLGGVTGALLRAEAPSDWFVADKSGSGSGSRNLVAMVTPPDAHPYMVSIYLSDTEADFETRNLAVTEIAGAIVQLIDER